MTLAAVIVTFNRKVELLKNIEMLMQQKHMPDKCYIIDNHSTDGTEEFLRINNILQIDWIQYVYLPQNIGGAGGFYTGSKLAYQNGYDFICLMDDDGRPNDVETLDILMKHTEECHVRNPLVFLNALVCGENDVLSFGLFEKKTNYKKDVIRKSHHGLIVGRVNPFNGTIISRELFKKIGFPNRQFFIKGDEYDFLSRAKNAKAFIATVVNANYYHPILEREKIRFLGKEYILTVESPWKTYYRVRNYTYIFSKNQKYNLIGCMLKEQVLGILFLSSKKKEMIKMVIKGIIDGFTGHMGKVI